MLRKWVTVAFDDYVSNTKGDNSYDSEDRKIHLVRFLKCKRTGHRKVKRDGAKGIRSCKRLDIAEAAWIDYNYLLISGDGTILDDDYANSELYTSRRYNYLPMKNSLDAMIAEIRKNPDYKQVKDHHLVADAMEQLETVIKMHENVDTPE